MLRAARDAGVKRVVLTSAFHAVSWGHPHSDHTFTENDWTILDGPGVDAYGKSKTLAERAAWDFMAAEGGALELTTMLPVAVMGPVMGKDISGSNHLIQRMLDGAMPAFPNLFIPIITFVTWPARTSWQLPIRRLRASGSCSRMAGRSR